LFSCSFLNAGLRNALGKFPSFIFDMPIDVYTRKMRLGRNNFTLDDFKKAKSKLESSMQVFIDTIQEDRTNGTVDIIYTQKELTKNFKSQTTDSLGRDRFTLGKSRSRVVTADLSTIPHLLVAGQTGNGKSTFMRQLITTFYLNNKNYTFELIDLKGGLEFQIFENLKRVEVRIDVESALSVLKKMNTKLDERKRILKHNHCKDFDSFRKIPEKDRKFPEGVQKDVRFGRHITVIDEAFDLFLVGALTSTKQVKEARRYSARLGAQGRALGLHIIIGTQRPDRFAIDPHLKTHLVGKICFRVPNNASSMTVLDNGRAADLPEIKGRALWQSGSDALEIQTPNLEEKETNKLLEPYRIKPIQDHKKNPKDKEESTDHLVLNTENIR